MALATDLSTDLQLIIVLISFLTSFISAYIGMIGGSIFLLFLLVKFDPQLALQFYTLHILLNSIVQVVLMKEHINVKESAKVLPILAIMTILGVFFYQPLSLKALKIVIGFFIFYAVAKNFSSKKSQCIDPEVAKKYDNIWLIASIILNNLAGLAGPVLGLFFLNKGYSKSQFVCAKSSMNILLRVSALIIYFTHQGLLLNNEHIVLLLFVTAVGIIATYIAKFFLNKVDPISHRKQIKIALCIVMIKSISESAMALI